MGAVVADTVTIIWRLSDSRYATHKRNDPVSLDQLAARGELPDPFDRMILATARAHGMPLVSPNSEPQFDHPTRDPG